MWLNLLKISSFLLLMLTMLQTGWSTDKPNDKKRLGWDKCIPKCQCINVDGRKQASCEKAGMNEIPTGLSDEVQILMFNYNNIRELRSKIFSSLGLVNLQKIYLKNCSIEEVDKHAFADLGLISYIDLSENRIKRLDPVTFQGAFNLRYLHINNNLIKRLDNDLFSNLPQLQTIELNFNQISEIGDRAFVNLPKLQTLTLKNNELVQLQPSIYQWVGNQKLYFDLRNNPWRCDCQLRQFFDFVKNNSFAGPTYCSEPQYMRDQEWQDLKREQFICSPDEKKVETTNREKVTLSCQLLADSNSKQNLTLNGFNTSGEAFSVNATDGNRFLLVNKIAEDRENITATILKQFPDQTLEEKLAIIIYQNELLRQKMEQLEAKIERSECFIPRKTTDPVPAQNRMKKPINNKEVYNAA